MATVPRPTLINPNPTAPKPAPTYGGPPVSLDFGSLVSRGNVGVHVPKTPQQKAREALLGSLAPDLQYLKEGNRRDQDLLGMLMGGGFGGSGGGGGGGGGGANPRLLAMQTEARNLEMANLKAMWPYWDQLLASQLAEISTRKKDDLSQLFSDATTRGATTSAGTTRDQGTIESLAKESSTQATLDIDRRRRDLWAQIRNLQMQMEADKISAAGGGGGGGGGSGGGGMSLSTYKDILEIQDRMSGRSLEKKKLFQGVASKAGQFPGKPKPKQVKGVTTRYV